MWRRPVSEPSDRAVAVVPEVAPPVAADTPPATVPPSVGSRAARGALTVFVGQISRIVIQVASVAVLARLLTPSDYGLVAIVIAIVGVGEIFRDFGLSTAAIQAAVVTRAQRNALFWLNTAIGAVLTLACILLAPLVADLFGHQELMPITRALGATFLLNGMIAQYQADLNRNLRFTALTVVGVGSQALGTIIAVICAWGGAGYWALVVQQLSAGLINLVAFAVLTRWLPTWPRRGVDVSPFLRFGGGLVLSQIVGYLNNNVDTLTIGLRFSAAQLGFYNRGYQLLMRPLSQLRQPTTSVALPVMRLVRDDRRRTDEFLVRGQRALGYTLVAGTAVAAGAARPMVQVFLGDGWSSVAPVFALLAFAGIFQTLSYVGNWVYLARGLTGKLVWYSLVSLAIKIVCVLVGSHWGIVGVAAGFAAAPALAWPLSLWWLARLTPMPVRRLYLGAGRVLLAAFVAAGTTYLVVQALHAAPAPVQMVVGCAAGFLSYGVLALVLPMVRRDLLDVLDAGLSAVRRRRP